MKIYYFNGNKYLKKEKAIEVMKEQFEAIEKMINIAQVAGIECPYSSLKRLSKGFNYYYSGGCMGGTFRTFEVQEMEVKE